MADIIISEGEMTSAVNKLGAYVDFLAECAKEYRRILTELSQQGIQDAAIKAALFDLQNEVNGYDQAIPESSEAAIAHFNAFLKQLASVDDFAYPYSMLDQISMVLARFF